MEASGPDPFAGIETLAGVQGADVPNFASGWISDIAASCTTVQSHLHGACFQVDCFLRRDARPHIG